MSEPLTAEQVRFMHDRFCQAFFDWGDALVAAYGPGVESPDSYEADLRLRRIALVVPDIRMAVSKSSYLGRRIYGGEKHRTEPCPIHKGRWRGLPFEETPCGCDLTGWLRVE